MRILHITDAYLPKIGGIEAMVSQLAERQLADGHEIRILTRAPGPSMPGVSRNPLELDDLVGWADVVHTHLSLVSPLASRGACVAAKAGRPTVASVHSMWTGGEHFLAPVGQALGWRRHPIQWAPVSRAAAAPVRKALGASASIEVLPNAIDLEAWRVDPVAHPEVHIVCVGRMAPRKRPLQALKMLEHARAMVSPEIAMRATFVGTGPLAGAIRSRVKSRNLDWIEVREPVKAAQLRELYAEADIFLAPSKLESFGLAALEARLAGLAVVARSNTGVGDFITPGEHGMLAGTDQQMAVQMALLASRPEQLAQIKNTNRTQRPDLGWDDLCERLDILYRRAAILQGKHLRHRPGVLLDASEIPDLTAGTADANSDGLDDADGLQASR